MIWFKACPKCHGGDLSQDADIYGSYIACQQCGHHLSEAEEAVLLGRRPPAGGPVVAGTGQRVHHEGNPLRMRNRKA